MTLKEADKIHAYILGSLSESKLKDCFDRLGELLRKLPNPGLKMKYDSLKGNYGLILRYSVQNAEDPQRQELILKLKKDILKLSDLVIQASLAFKPDNELYAIKRQKEDDSHIDEDILGKVEECSLDDELGELLKDSGLDKKDDYDDSRLELLGEVFLYVWLMDGRDDVIQRIVEAFNDKKSFVWHERAVLVSALLMSLLRNFDERKVKILLAYYMDREKHVWQRALTALVLVLYFYDNRLAYYPGLMASLKVLEDDETRGHLEMIMIQLLRAKDTEKVSRKLEEEILPEMIKFAPKLEDRLNLGDVLSDDMDDKNPEWEELFKDSPGLYSKMEEFSNMQMEGSDIFMSAFSMLKKFDFFKSPHNWFMPFFPENPILNDIFKDKDLENLEANDFLLAFSKSPYMCSSDKYSFCFNLRQMPVQQKKMILGYFMEELKNMGEVADEDNMLKPVDETRFIFNRYIQDLYRFFKLHPHKNAVTDIFKLDLDVHNSEFFRLFIDDKKVLSSVGNFLFEKGHYRSAIEAFRKLEEKGDVSYEIFEKTAYAYQKVKDYNQALEYYLRAELFDQNREWLIRKIAFCYSKLKDYSKAISYYKEALKIKADDKKLLAAAGYACLDNKDYEEALNYFYKLELLQDDDLSAMRPLAWIAFILKRFDTAVKYYEKIIRDDATRFDYLNYGHVRWCLGDKATAAELYKKSILQKDNSYTVFLKSFEDDQKYLISNGINREDIPLMLDFLAYSLDDF